MKKNTFILITCILKCSFSTNGFCQQTAKGKEYIKNYTEIAKSEMTRTGIPTSIKLAQGLLESGSGTSELAKNANNHFGIKCGSDWQGDTYFLEDDDFDTCGILSKSCFRKFDSPKESYVAHSAFLTNPAKVNRYGFLFTFDTKDYKSWAYGLKKAGYATNPRYAEQLIKIIEDYKLYDLDILIEKRSVSNVVQANENQKKDQHSFLISQINGVKLIKLRHKTNVASMVEALKLNKEDIKKFNPEILDFEKDYDSGTIIFLEQRKKAYHGSTKVHKVKQNETLEQIAMNYAIDDLKLRKRNKISRQNEVKAGEIIALRGWYPFKKSPNQIIKTDYLEKDAESYKDSNILVQSEEFPYVSNESNTLVFHLVEKGDTLFSISKKYHTQVDQLKILNQLASSDIKIGTRLRVE